MISRADRGERVKICREERGERLLLRSPKNTIRLREEEMGLKRKRAWCYQIGKNITHRQEEQEHMAPRFKHFHF